MCRVGDPQHASHQTGVLAEDLSNFGGGRFGIVEEGNEPRHHIGHRDELRLFGDLTEDGF